MPVTPPNPVVQVLQHPEFSWHPGPRDLWNVEKLKSAKKLAGGARNVSPQRNGSIDLVSRRKMTPQPCDQKLREITKKRPLFCNKTPIFARAILFSPIPSISC